MEEERESVCVCVPLCVCAFVNWRQVREREIERKL